MNARPNATARPEPDGATRTERDGNTISPLPGEPGIPNVAAAAQRMPMSKKGLLAVVLLIALAGRGRRPSRSQRFAASGKKADDADVEARRRPPDGRHRRAAQARDAAGTGRAVAGVAAAAPRIPALVPTAEEAGRADRRSAHRSRRSPHRAAEVSPSGGCTRPAGVHAAGRLPAQAALQRRGDARRSRPSDAEQPSRRPDDPLDADTPQPGGLPAPACRACSDTLTKSTARRPARPPGSAARSPSGRAPSVCPPGGSRAGPAPPGAASSGAAAGLGHAAGGRRRCSATAA